MFLGEWRPPAPGDRRGGGAAGVLRAEIDGPAEHEPGEGGAGVNEQDGEQAFDGHGFFLVSGFW